MQIVCAGDGLLRWEGGIQGGLRTAAFAAHYGPMKRVHVQQEGR